MIKINLKSQAQSRNAIIGGMDLSKLNIKFVIGALLFTAFAPGFTSKWLESERGKVQTKVDTLRAEKKKYDTQMQELAEMEQKILVMQQEEASFKNRIDLLNNLLKVKANPMNILHYIAKNIPESVWINRLEISDKKLQLVGNSLDYESMGKFESALNQSIFFNKSAKISDYKTKQNNDNSVRLEEFKITASIERYE